MSIKVLAVMFLAVITVLMLGAAIMLIRSMFIATKGRRITRYSNPRKALVVLDIQEGYSGTNTRQPVTTSPVSFFTVIL